MRKKVENNSVLLNIKINFSSLDGIEKFEFKKRYFLHFRWEFNSREKMYCLIFFRPLQFHTLYMIKLALNYRFKMDTWVDFHAIRMHCGKWSFSLCKNKRFLGYLMQQSYFWILLLEKWCSFWNFPFCLNLIKVIWII